MTSLNGMDPWHLLKVAPQAAVLDFWPIQCDSYLFLIVIPIGNQKDEDLKISMFFFVLIVSPWN